MNTENINEKNLWKNIEADVDILENHMKRLTEYADPEEIIAYVFVMMQTAYRHTWEESNNGKQDI